MRAGLAAALRPLLLTASVAALPEVLPAGPQEPVRELRIALVEGAAAARISAPAPFVLRAGALEIEAVEALISPETVLSEGTSGRVLALGAFSSVESAREAIGSFREQRPGEGAPRLERHPETGRTLAVLRSLPAGEAEVGRLRADGFPAAGIFELPAAHGDALVIRPLGGSPIRIPGGVSLTAAPPGEGFLEWEGKPYRGALTVARQGNGVRVINRVGLEDYLAGVVPLELPPDLFPEPEALKAQALAARTYALRPRDAYLERGFDLCASPACQVYGGVAAEHPMATAAVRETAGEAIWYEGRLIDALYTAACGGHTENAENVFSTPTPYLVARACIRETGGVLVPGRAPADSPLDAALARVAGPLPEGWRGAGLGESASGADAGRVIGAAVAWLGLPVCSAPGFTGEDLSLGGFAELVEAVRCRGPDGPARGPAPDGSELAAEGPPAVGRLLAEGLLDPSERGLDPERAVSRREVAAVAARLLRREGRLLRRGQIREAGADGIVIEPDGPAGRGRRGGDPAPERFPIEPEADARLFREIRPTRVGARPEPVPLAIPVERLRLRVGDFVRYRPLAEPDDARGGDGRRIGFDVLILEDLGAALDRFSRRAAWLVPKNNRDLSAAVAEVKPIGTITALEPLETGVSGRVVRMRIVGTEGELEVRGLRIRRLLGLSENLFVAEARRNEAGEITEWWFSGRGWGHGLGLCQAGAYGMAAAGADYREILAHYYPGTTVAVHHTPPEPPP